MTIADILTMVKANLEIINSISDTYLTQLINVSVTEIEREGITLDSSDYSMDDANLIAMYTAYLYRNRANDGRYQTTALSSVGMPRMLRYAMNNRLLSEKMQ